jgi:hypothetical protein
MPDQEFDPRVIINALERQKDIAAKTQALPKQLPGTIVISTSERDGLNARIKQLEEEQKKRKSPSRLKWWAIGAVAATTFFVSDSYLNEHAQKNNSAAQAPASAEIEQAKKSAAESNKQLIAARAEYSAVKNERDSAKTSLEAAQKEVTHYKAKAMTEGIASEEDHKLLLEKTKELAGVKIDVENYQKKNEELNRTVKQLNSDIESYKKSGAENTAQILASGVRVSELLNKANALAETVSQKDKKISELEAKLNEQASTASAESTEYQKMLASYKQRLDKITKDVKDLDKLPLLREYQAKLKKIEKAGGLMSVGIGDKRLVPVDEYVAYELLRLNFEKAKTTYGCKIAPSPDSLPELNLWNIREIDVTSKSTFIGGDDVCFPPEINCLKYLERLCVDNLVINSDLALQDLPNLKFINFPNCKSESLSGFGKLPALVELSLENSYVREISDIFDLPLRRVNLLNSRMTSLEHFDKMPALKELIVAGCPIDYRAPENKAALKNLRDKGVNVIITGEEYYKWLDENKGK